MNQEKITFKDARIKAGISSSAMMARLMNMSEQSYNLKENYNREFKASELMRFCEITKTRPSQLKVV